MESILPNLQTRPQFLLLENVKNFETSNSHQLLITTLEKLNYDYEEFLVSPVSLGIPNERLRYYLVAVQGSGKSVKQEIQTVFPQGYSQLIEPAQCRVLKPFLFCQQNKDEEEKVCLLKKQLVKNVDELLLADSCFDKHKGYRFDVVSSTSTITSCFTKGYGKVKFVRGTGPLLITNCSENEEEIDFNDPQSLKALKLRWFHPLEIATLLGFPTKLRAIICGEEEEEQAREQFSFPNNVTLTQCYEALGNSINVTVVSRLMKYMFEKMAQVSKK